MATYKTAPIIDYDVSFRDIAQRLFDATSHQPLLPPRSAILETGSYSFRPTHHSQERVAKIVIFQRSLGVPMRGELPWRDDGVYVLVRANGENGNLLWRERMNGRFWERMRREDNVAIAPNHAALFAYFPVMAGESLDAIAGFIAPIVHRVSERHEVEARP